MSKQPAWFPLPRSWVNALGLILLMAGIQYGSSFVWQILLPIIRLFPRLGTLVYVAIAILLPIGLIALLHHWLHRFLDQVFPDSRISDETATDGLFPSLLSWWEGLYGWLVSYFATLAWSVLLSILLPLPNLVGALAMVSPSAPAVIVASPWNPLYGWYIGAIALQTIVAACLYQFEFLVRLRLLESGTSQS